MSVEMLERKEWKVCASDLALNTHNPIRAIVESLQLEPNPEKQMIALSIGDPTIFGNLSPPQVAVDAIKKSVEQGIYNGYAASSGYLAARQAVAEYSSSDNFNIDAKDVILCSGCSSALDLCISVLANRGQNILIPRPGFSIYRTLAEGLGVRVKPYNLQPETGWTVDLNHLESQIDGQTTAIIINNPSNPCGSVFTKTHLQDILDTASRHRLPIIADEIYEFMVFPGEDFHPLASLSTDVPILSCSGLTKRFLCPGWRMGWIIIHDKNEIFEMEVRTGLIKLSQRIMGSNTIIQGALPEILRSTSSDFYNVTIKTLQRNAVIVYKHLSEIPGLIPVMPQGAMYLMIGIHLAAFPDIGDEIQFIERMVTEESVFCLPGKCFDYPNYMRMVITAPEEMLREACERMARFCARHYKSPNKKSPENIVATFRGGVSVHANLPISENSGRKP